MFDVWINIYLEVVSTVYTTCIHAIEWFVPCRCSFLGPITGP